MIPKTNKKIVKQQIINKMRVSEIEDILKCNGLKPDEMAVFVTQKKMTRHTFTEWVLKSGEIDQLYISTYRMSIIAAQYLRQYIDNGAIKDLKIILAQNYRMLLRDNAVKLISILDHKNIRLRLAYNHSKITLIKQLDKYYVLTGSGNYSENDHIEEYQLINSKDLYEFHKGWMDGETKKI